MKWETVENYEELSERGAQILLKAISSNPGAVLGLPTGRTPVGMYNHVAHECERAYHCFRDVTTFNLDEYVGLPRDHYGTYFTYMKKHLFDFVDIDPANAHVPDGCARDPLEESMRYEREIVSAGGIDLIFLGLGPNSHIGFNEPGTAFSARTHVVDLTASTRKANAPLFKDGHVPTQAITMGIGTILESRRIVLLASGSTKRDAVAQLRSGVVDEAYPASALWLHSDVTVVADRAADG